MCRYVRSVRADIARNVTLGHSSTVQEEKQVDSTDDRVAQSDVVDTEGLTSIPISETDSDVGSHPDQSHAEVETAAALGDQ